MTTGHAMMAMSLDGFVARKDRTLDWLTKQATADEDHGYAQFESSVDVIVMGRGSFETVLGFGQWPYQKPVVVMSRSLQESDMSQDVLPKDRSRRVSLSRLEPSELMISLEKEGHRRAYIDGAALVQSFMRADLITDMKITVVPILIGEGIRLFGPQAHDCDLVLQSAEHFPSGLVDLAYTFA